MYIYEAKGLYDKFTGEKLTVKEYVISEFRCDYTGRVISSKIGNDHGEWYNIDTRNIDQCVGCCDDERELAEKCGIFPSDLFDFLFQPYMFSMDWNCLELAEPNALIEMYDQIDLAKIYTSKPSPASLTHLLRAMRTKTAMRLLEAGEVTPEQLLGFDIEEQNDGLR